MTFVHICRLIYNTNLANQLLGIQGKERLFNDPELKGIINSLNFKVNNQKLRWNLLPAQPDIRQIILHKALNPSDTINVTTPFHVKISKWVTYRLSHIGKSYQISKWYPKPAGYDQSGWHQILIKIK